MLASLFCEVSHADSGSLTIILNRVQSLRLSGEAGTVMVGNPTIANVSLEDAEHLVLVGLAVGQTNLIVTGVDGRVLLSRAIFVVSPTGNSVSVKRGGKPAQAFLCAPRCEGVTAAAGPDAARRAVAPPTEE